MKTFISELSQASLPNGWHLNEPYTFPYGSVAYQAQGPHGTVVLTLFTDGTCRWSGSSAPLAVYTALLRAAGASS